MTPLAGSSSFGFTSSVPGRVQFNGISADACEVYVWSTADCYVSVSQAVTSATAQSIPIFAYQPPIPLGVTERWGPNNSSAAVGHRFTVSALAVSGGGGGTTYAMPVSR